MIAVHFSSKLFKVDEDLICCILGVSGFFVKLNNSQVKGDLRLDFLVLVTSGNSSLVFLLVLLADKRCDGRKVCTLQIKNLVSLKEDRVKEEKGGEKAMEC